MQIVKCTIMMMHTLYGHEITRWWAGVGIYSPTHNDQYL